jgi:hypothetical protein
MRQAPLRLRLIKAKGDDRRQFDGTISKGKPRIGADTTRLHKTLVEKPDTIRQMKRDDAAGGTIGVCPKRVKCDW